MSKARELADVIGTQDTTENVLQGRKNLIINGAMQVAQRGTSFSTPNNTHSLDRYKHFISQAGNWTVTQDSDAPSGFAKSLKFDCTTANTSLAAGAYNVIDYHIESQDLVSLAFGTADAKNITFSFWVKSNKTGTYNFNIANVERSGQPQVTQSYTIDSADTWEYKTFTFNGDTSNSFDLDTTIGIRISLWFVAGTTYSSGTNQSTWSSEVPANRAVGQVNLADSTSNYLNITGVQLEVGSVATPFEHRSYGEELALCQRYYQRKTERIASGCTGNVNTLANVRVDFFPSMRTTPSMIVNSYGNVLREYVAWFPVTAASFTEATNHNGNITLTVGGTHSMAEGHGTLLGNGADYSFDAEL